MPLSELTMYRLVPVNPTTNELAAFGFRPGAHTILCPMCGQRKGGCDMHSLSCEPCATTRYKRIIGNIGMEISGAAVRALITPDEAAKITGAVQPDSAPKPEQPPEPYNPTKPGDPDGKVPVRT